MTKIADEILDGIGLLSSYFKDLSGYLNNGSSLPNLEVVEGSLGYDNLMTYSNESTTLAPNFMAGLSNEAVSEFVAVEREIAMGKVSKSSLYDNASAEALMEADHYTKIGDFKAGVFNGAPTSGAIS